MFENQKKSKSLCMFPPINQSSSLEASKFLQKYLQRMRGVQLTDHLYTKNSKTKESLKSQHIIKKNTIKKTENNDHQLIKETIHLYIDTISNIFNQKTSQHYRRLMSKTEELIRNCPQISGKLFQKDGKKLIIDTDVLQFRLGQQHQPILTQIIQKIQECSKYQQNQQLYSLGNRVKALKTNLVKALNTSIPNADIKHILRIHPQGRSNQSISRNLADCEMKYGKLSKDLHNRQQFFSNINKVLEMIQAKK